MRKFTLSDFRSQRTYNNLPGQVDSICGDSAPLVLGSVN